jgi:serine/threonine protein kinase
MAAEYAMRGQYSVKSDVFSLGVLILEMVTGRKNSSFADSEQPVDLLSLVSTSSAAHLACPKLVSSNSLANDLPRICVQVWEHWTTGAIEELLDPFLGRRAPRDQMLKLVNIALLCVQDSPADRPMMSSVNVMLSSDTVSLQVPSRPTFCIQEMEDGSSFYSQSASKESRATMSPNEA